MKVETFIITWNREDTIHLSIKHYLQLGRVILYDNFSDDRTRDIAQELGAEVRLFGRAGELNDQDYLEVKNNCWKGSQADWVIVVDDDEILYGDLSKAQGCTIVKPQGFNIHSDLMPVDNWLEIKSGEKNENYSKLCCFNPKEIKEIRYNYGCHAARPIGNVKIFEGLYLLHYREVGGVERLIKRHKEYASRLSEVNRRYNLGHHYSETEESKRKQWKEFTERCATSFEAGLPS
jgi:glycosyltransferase involved in cell wall biosynthesis